MQRQISLLPRHTIPLLPQSTQSTQNTYEKKILAFSASSRRLTPSSQELKRSPEPTVSRGLYVSREYKWPQPQQKQRGVPGPQGPRGVPGPQGPRGPRGAPGPKGQLTGPLKPETSVKQIALNDVNINKKGYLVLSNDVETSVSSIKATNRILSGNLGPYVIPSSGELNSPSIFLYDTVSPDCGVRINIDKDFLNSKGFGLRYANKLLFDCSSLNSANTKIIFTGNNYDTSQVNPIETIGANVRLGDKDGVVSCPSPLVNSDSEQVATTSFVKKQNYSSHKYSAQPSYFFDNKVTAMTIPIGPYSATSFTIFRNQSVLSSVIMYSGNSISKYTFYPNDLSVIPLRFALYDSMFNLVANSDTGSFNDQIQASVCGNPTTIPLVEPVYISSFGTYYVWLSCSEVINENMLWSSGVSAAGLLNNTIDTLTTISTETPQFRSGVVTFGTESVIPPHSLNGLRLNYMSNCIHLVLS